MKTPGLGRHALVWLTIALATVWAWEGCALSAPKRPVEEMEVKAAFIVNFIRFVNWTDLPQESGTIQVCVLGATELSEAVRRLAMGKAIGTRSVSVLVTSNPTPEKCRVVVFASDQYRTARSTLRPLESQPVLTIGDGGGFLELGGMLQLIVEDGKVQFEAGLAPIRKSGLEVSARLLRLARNIKMGRDGP